MKPANNSKIISFLFTAPGIFRSNTQYLERNDLNHEGHFGLVIKDVYNTGGHIQIENIEHAKQLIAALETAVDFGWLLSEAEIESYAVKGTTTLQDLIEAKDS